MGAKTFHFCVKPRQQSHLSCYLLKFQSNASSHFSSVGLRENVERDRLARKGSDKELNILHIFLCTQINFKFLLHVMTWLICFALSLSLPISDDYVCLQYWLQGHSSKLESSLSKERNQSPHPDLGYRKDSLQSAQRCAQGSWFWWVQCHYC